MTAETCSGVAPGRETEAFVLPEPAATLALCAGGIVLSVYARRARSRVRG